MTLVQPWRPEVCEGLGHALLVLAEGRAPERGTASTSGLEHLCIRLGLRPSRRAGSGCHGALSVTERRIWWAGPGHGPLAAWRLAHELGHVAASLADTETPHDERGVDLVALVLALPRGRMAALLREGSLDAPEALVVLVPELPAPWVLLRAAWVLGARVVIHGSAGRLVWTPDDPTLADPGWEEMALVRGVRRSGEPQRTLWGMRGTPFPDGDRVGVLVRR